MSLWGSLFRTTQKARISESQKIRWKECLFLRTKKIQNRLRLRFRTSRPWPDSTLQNQNGSAEKQRKILHLSPPFWYSSRQQQSRARFKAFGNQKTDFFRLKNTKRSGDNLHSRFNNSLLEMEWATRMVPKVSEIGHLKYPRFTKVLREVWILTLAKYGSVEAFFC